MSDIDLPCIDYQKVNSWIKGEEDDGVQRENNFPEPGSEWFVISMKWLKKWKILAGIDQGFLDSENIGPVDSSDIIIDNNDIWKEDNEFFIKSGLLLGEDYEIVPPKAWSYFITTFGANQTIKRYSVQFSEDNTQVEITYKPLKVFYIMRSELKTENPVIVYVPHKSEIGDIMTKLRSLYKTKNNQHVDKNYIRLWHLDPKISIEQFKENIKKSTKIFPGKFLKEKLMLEDAEVADDDVIAAELKSSYITWSFNNPNDTDVCKYCSKAISKYIKCSCGRFKYCDSTCIENDRISHRCSDRNSYSESDARFLSPSPSSRNGIAGLQNLGNTCFMNSGLQCMSNTYPISQYLLNDDFLEDINYENPLGTQGQIVKEYAYLIRELWYGSNTYVSPWKFKRALAKFAPQFSGFHQQDSQEMLSFLLDGLHEDLNRVKKKPYVSQIDIAGLTDQDAAKAFWNVHTQRNQSIIIDLMYGQYRSEVECPECHNVSLAFDPFLMLALPIPSKEQVSLDVYYVSYSEDKTPLKIKILVNKNYNWKTVNEEIAKIIQTQNSIIFGIVSGQSLEKLGNLEKIENNKMLFAYEIPDAGSDEAFIILEFVKESSNYMYPQGETAGYPRLFKVSKNATLQQIHYFIYLYVMWLFGEDSKSSNDFQNSFPLLFPSIYTLKLVNPNKKRYTYYSSFSSACPYCHDQKCMNCKLPYDEETLQDYLNKFPDGNLKLELNFSSNYNSQMLKKLKEANLHEKYQETAQRHQDQKEASITLDDCLNLFSTREQLDEHNNSWCSKCKEHVRGIKKMDIFKLPKILIIHLKRFKQVGHYNSKNSKKVEFPMEELDMGKYALADTGIYDLYAVSNHYGALGGGHYTAYCRNYFDKKWYHFDDNSVSTVRDPQTKIIDSAAYVLFYMKRD
ncbi:unnamed protein product [Blepharisma stoltei]|uniref:Ubiquitin carboxyl-terminal hydrolase n=1 Tax=Blepharisma stoltei TaxID=1481888 RepID=A0AAU9JA38_9CILI|nr:unnamed protein product [Blepharisma stoltei]